MSIPLNVLRLRKRHMGQTNLMLFLIYIYLITIILFDSM